MFRSYREGTGMNITSLILKISFFLAVLQLYLSVQNFICVYLCVYGGVGGA